MCITSDVYVCMYTLSQQHTLTMVGLSLYCQLTLHIFERLFDMYHGCNLKQLISIYWFMAYKNGHFCTKPAMVNVLLLSLSLQLLYSVSCLIGICLLYWAVRLHLQIQYFGIKMPRKKKKSSLGRSTPRAKKLKQVRLTEDIDTSH